MLLTAAGFSGCMPCAELSDSIVQWGRRTLESAILFGNTRMINGKLGLFMMTLIGIGCIPFKTIIL